MPDRRKSGIASGSHLLAVLDHEHLETHPRVVLTVQVGPTVTAELGSHRSPLRVAWQPKMAPPWSAGRDVRRTPNTSNNKGRQVDRGIAAAVGALGADTVGMVAAPLPECVVDGDLVVRIWAMDDAPLLHTAVIRNLEHLRPFMPWIADEPQSLEERAARIDEWEATRQAGGDAIYGVFLGGAVAGGSGLHRRVGPQGLEIGYWVDAAHTGRGLATRVARVLTSAAFTIPGITHVKIACDEANRPSSRVAEKLDYACVGVIAVPANSPAATGRHLLYRMDRARWLSDRLRHTSA